MQGKVKPANSAVVVYAGIDVSKAWLDVYVHPVGEQLRLANTGAGLRQLRRRLAGLRIERLVLEATGKLHRLAHRTLSAWGYPVAVVNPLRARLFAEACGMSAKTDRLDARLLALMAEALKPAPAAPVSARLAELAELVQARAAAVADLTRLGNQLDSASSGFLRSGLRRRCSSLEVWLKRLEAEIATTLEGDPDLAARYAIVASIPGIGPVTAISLVVGLSEMGALTGKQASRLAGLAPIADDSGTRTGQRHIRGGRAQLRHALYMAALAASRYNPDLKAFYDRLRANGKAAKLALTAVMRKLVVLANTLIAHNRPWSPSPPANP